MTSVRTILLRFFYFMNKYSNEFLNETIKVWQPHNPAPLTLNDAREITENMTALFNLLINNDGKLKGKEK